LKKIDPSFSIIYFLSILLILPLSIAAMELDIESTATDKRIEVRFSLSDLPARDLYRNITEGEIAEIVYELQIFEERQGIFFFIGDRRVAKRRESYSLSFSSLSETYRLESAGRVMEFDDFSEMQGRLASVSLQITPTADSEPDYLRARVVLIHRRLIPPFIILEPLLGDNKVSSPWKREEIRGRGVSDR